MLLFPTTLVKRRNDARDHHQQKAPFRAAISSESLEKFSATFKIINSDMNINDFNQNPDNINLMEYVKTTC